ncbi:MAG: hypothetical protein P8Y94_14740, partial [Acidobacteriota bacterium]
MGRPAGTAYWAMVPNEYLRALARLRPPLTVCETAVLRIFEAEILGHKTRRDRGCWHHISQGLLVAQTGFTRRAIRFA